MHCYLHNVSHLFYFRWSSVLFSLFTFFLCFSHALISVHVEQALVRKGNHASFLPFILPFIFSTVFVLFVVLIIFVVVFPGFSSFLMVNTIELFLVFCEVRDDFLISVECSLNDYFQEANRIWNSLLSYKAVLMSLA